MSRLRAAGAALFALTLAGCAGGPSLLSGDAPASLDVTMQGRWMLAAPNAPVCGMNFSSSPGASEGNVTPEGGCPERFYTSRRWTLRQGALTINDDNNATLANLTYAGGQFEGKSAAETPVTLAR